MRPDPRTAIVPMPYQPPGRYRMAVEIKLVSMKDGRPSLPFPGMPERMDFHLFIYLLSGDMRHSVDLGRLRCRAGSLLAIRPGQVHQWMLQGSWRAWLVLFRPELVRARADRRDLSLSEILDALPAHIVLDASEQESVREVMTRMAADARRHAPLPELEALLRAELEGLIRRLKLAHARAVPDVVLASTQAWRFRRFRAAVESHFAQIRNVAHYARMLGCSEKSLSRASLDGSGLPAKVFIARRVALEARRILAHTDVPTADIGLLLGFDEPSNFGKFFRRMAGVTPGAFRRRHRPAGASSPWWKSGPSPGRARSPGRKARGGGIPVGIATTSNAARGGRRSCQGVEGVLGDASVAKRQGARSRPGDVERLPPRAAGPRAT